MPKNGYTITRFTGQTINSQTKDVLYIQSTINLVFLPPLQVPGPGISASIWLLSSGEVANYINYITNNIQSIWNSYTAGAFTLGGAGGITVNNPVTIQNYGLHSPFCSSNDAIFTQVTINAFNLVDLYNPAIFIQDANGNPIIPNGQCVIGVDLNPVGSNGFNRPMIFGSSTNNSIVLQTPNDIGGGLNTGIFYYDYLPLAQTGGTLPTSYFPLNPQFLNFPAHEFGHILGLADRYQQYARSKNEAVTVTPIDSTSNLIQQYTRNYVPMYLPGFFDSTFPTYDTFANYYYNQPPYGSVPPPYNPTNFIINSPNSPTTAPPTLLNRDPYLYITTGPDNEQNYFDIDYSTKYGWLHNLMSNPISPNDIYNWVPPTGTPPVYPPTSGTLPAARSILSFILNQGTTAESTYVAIYLNDILQPVVANRINYTQINNPTIIITKRQIDIISQNGINDPDALIIENQRFPNIFNPYVFIKHNDASDFIANSGTYIGLLRDYNNVTNISNSIQIVTDESEISTYITNRRNNIRLGIYDTMDYRFCNINPSDQWSIRPESEQGSYLGCYTPFDGQNTINTLISRFLGTGTAGAPAFRDLITVGETNDNKATKRFNCITVISQINGNTPGNLPTNNDLQFTADFYSAVGEGFENQANIADIFNVWNNHVLVSSDINSSIGGSNFNNFVTANPNHPIINLVNTLFIYNTAIPLTTQFIGRYTQMQPSAGLTPGTTEPIWQAGVGYLQTNPNQFIVGVYGNSYVYRIRFNIYRNRLTIIDMLTN